MISQQTGSQPQRETIAANRLTDAHTITISASVTVTTKLGNSFLYKKLEERSDSLYNAHLRCCSAPVAQLDRVLGYEPRGRAFESLRARQYNLAFRPIFGLAFLFLAPPGGTLSKFAAIAPCFRYRRWKRPVAKHTIFRAAVQRKSAARQKPHKRSGYRTATPSRPRR